MRTKEMCTCRGDGKAYIRLSITGLADMEKLSLHGETMEGITIPTQLYCSDENKSSKEVVLIFPLSPYPVKLHLYSAALDDSIRTCYKSTIDPFILKWKSRFNYRFKNDLCRVTRDIEKQISPGRTGIAFESCIVAEDANIVRGIIELPESASINEIPIVLNDSFQPVEVRITIMNKIVEQSYSGEDYSVTSFSVHLPKDTADYTFKIDVDSESRLSCFSVLTRQHLDELRAVFAESTLNAAIDQRYDTWLKTNRATIAENMKARATTLPNSPLISIVVPLYETPVNYFNEMVSSVLNQTYQSFELILVNASPDNAALQDALAAIQDFENVRIINLEKNEGISRNTAVGVAAARGEYIGFFDHDDTLEEDALFSYVCALNENPNIDLMYCDEDKLLGKDHYGDAYFKPDFSKYLLRQMNYICHFLVVRKTLLDQLSIGDAIYDGAQDHHLILQAVEKDIIVHHVPKILYHWRVHPGSTAAGTGNKSYANDAARLAIRRHLSNLGIVSSVKDTQDNCRFCVLYEPEDKPHV